MTFNDTTFGFLILGIGILLVLGIVFAISLRESAGGPRPHPPRGVHLPSPSLLPVVLSVGGALLGAGLAFRPDDALANAWLAVPGLIVFVLGVIAWVRAANREWRDMERAPHDDRAPH